MSEFEPRDTNSEPIGITVENADEADGEFVGNRDQNYRIRRRRSSGIYSLLFVFSVGAAGAIGWEYRGMMLPHPGNLKIPENSQDINPNKLTLNKDIQNLDDLISGYFDSKNTDDAIFQGYSGILAINPSRETVGFAHQISRDYFYKSVILFQSQKGDKELYFQNEDQRYLSFENRTFDLSNLYDYHLASSLIDISLNSLKSDAKHIQTELDSEKSLLLWLKDQNYNIQFENDSFAFFNKESMLTLASTLYQIKDIAPKPPLIIFYNYGDPRYQREQSSGYYDCDRYENLTDILNLFRKALTDNFEKNCPIIISNRIYPDSIAHEIGHFAAGSGDKFTYDDFNSIVNASQKEFADQVLNKQNSYISGYAQTNLHEDYAETFSDYIANGDLFRQKLKQLRWYDYGSYKILLAKYAFFKKMLSENQFSSNGQIMVNGNEDPPGLGQSYFITDFSLDTINNKGIPLLKNPMDLNSTDQSLVVFDGISVQVVDGPRFVKGQNGEYYTMWMIKNTDQLTTPLAGWIAQEWFYDKANYLEPSLVD